MEEEYGSGVGSYLSLIGTYFSFMEIIAVGLMFWISCGSSGRLILLLFNLALNRSGFVSGSSSLLMKSFIFVKGWALSIVVLVAMSFAFLIFILYGAIATWLLILISEFLGIKEPINFLGTTIAMAVAFVVGNTVALIKSLSKQIKWLNCGNEFPGDHEKRVKKFKELDSYCLDFMNDNIGSWPKG